jgi:hypothetical protein
VMTPNPRTWCALRELNIEAEAQWCGTSDANQPMSTGSLRTYE